MVDLDTVADILAHLDTYLGQLRDLAACPREDLRHDLIRLGAAKHYLQVAIECCIDLANHIIAQQGFRSPTSYADVFTVLAENRVIERDFLPTAHQMVKMRNRLVHLYWEVDPDLLYDILQNNLGDFDRFKAAVLAFIRSR